jgi:hypothetical protein
VEPEFLDEGKSTQRYLGKRFFLALLPEDGAWVNSLFPQKLAAISFPFLAIYSK